MIYDIDETSKSLNSHRITSFMVSMSHMQSVRQPFATRNMRACVYTVMFTGTSVKNFVHYLYIIL